MYNIKAETVIIKQNGEEIASLNFTSNQSSYFLDLPLEGKIDIIPSGGTTPRIGLLTVVYQKEILPTDNDYNDFNKITNVAVSKNIKIDEISAATLENNSNYNTDNFIDIYKKINDIIITEQGNNHQLASFSYLQLSINPNYRATDATRATCYKAYINNSEIDLSKIKEYQLKNLDITSLKIGLGIKAECGYYTQAITYAT
jgi:hypothetical protein